MRWEDAVTKDPNTGVATFSSEKHRKIRLYRAAADTLDSNGHGTHVMGSLLGSPYDSSDLTSVNFRRARDVSPAPVHVAPEALQFFPVDITCCPSRQLCPTWQQVQMPV